MKRIISFMVFLILSQNTFAGSYITTKHEFKSKD